MELKIILDEEKLRDIVAQAVEELKAAGWLYREDENEEE